MEEQVKQITVAYLMTLPFWQMHCDNYHLTANQTQVDINDVFQSHSPQLLWLVLLNNKSRSLHLPEWIPSRMHDQRCTRDKSQSDKYEIYDLLLKASGKCKQDAYLLNPDAFDDEYFIISFHLTAVQDGGESSTPSLCTLVNIRLTFSSGNPALQALFFYNMDENLTQVDSHGSVEGPIPF